MEDLMMTIEEMRNIRDSRGYSFKKLSEYSGVPVVTLQKIFSGATANPRKSTLDAIERVLLADEAVFRGKAFEYKEGVKEDTFMVKDNESSYIPGKKQGEYTLEDYYTLPDEQRVELIDGVFYDMSSPRTVHQDIIFYIHLSFYNHIREKKKPCKVFEAPVDVQLDCDNRTMVQPDVLVICDRDRLKGFGIYGAPDFVLEVLSKSTRKKDMSIKLEKYLYAGVREYWVIDPYKEVLITYNFMDEDFVPCIHPLTGSVPVAISDGELEIDMEPVAESIRELGSLE
jgi:Uma2 family endonuclease